MGRCLYQKLGHSRKDLQYTPHTKEISVIRKGGGGGGGKENLLLIIVKCATGHAKGGGGINFQFLWRSRRSLGKLKIL